ncbi:unnamed protein product [Coregonus sp. 'balchen']|nr:unnamed protein product [Coregonus sp. 'balchen']
MDRVDLFTCVCVPVIGCITQVNEDQLKQMESENSFITRWNDKKDTTLSPTMRSEELAESTLVMRNVVTTPVDLWITFEVIENGELGRKQKQFMRGEQVKFKDGSSKLLSGHKFQDRYVILRDEKLLLYKEMKSTKPEREVPLKLVKCYLGLKRKLKPPTSWGFTVYTDKQQWHFCCEGKESQIDWVTDIITMKEHQVITLRLSTLSTVTGGSVSLPLKTYSEKVPERQRQQCYLILLIKPLFSVRSDHEELEEF